MRGRRRWWIGTGALITVAGVVAALVFATGSSGSARGAAAPSPSAPTRSVAEAFAILARAETAIRTEAAAPKAADSDPMPTCAAPPLPPPTYPTPQDPTEPYGIPFRAAVTGGTLTGPLGSFPATGGKLLAGYDIQWALGAAHGGYTQVWKSVVWNLTGWATGLLELPSLTSIQNQVVFCGATSNPPTTIYIALVQGISSPLDQGYITNSQALIAQQPTNDSYLNATVTLEPVPDSTSLSVKGVAPDGGLELTGTSSANTSLHIGHPSIPVQNCHQTQATTLSLSTEPVTDQPGGPEPPPAYPIVPQPLAGPIKAAGATVTSNTSDIPAFVFNIKSKKEFCSEAIIINPEIAGWDQNGVSKWPCPPKNDPSNENCTTFAGEPGWNQFGADVRLQYIDIQGAPPPGFSF